MSNTDNAYQRGYQEGWDRCLAECAQSDHRADNKIRSALKNIADIAEDPECDDLEDVAILCISIAKNALFFEVCEEKHNES